MDEYLLMTHSQCWLSKQESRGKIMFSFKLKSLICLLQASDAAPKDFLGALQSLLDRGASEAASWHGSLKKMRTDGKKSSEQQQLKEAANMTALTEQFSAQVCLVNLALNSRIGSFLPTNLHAASFCYASSMPN